jgi:Asp-tRNA(Asn)/Glu-tRNA(Gln) amidotransferase A subunit family amidase
MPATALMMLQLPFAGLFPASRIAPSFRAAMVGTPSFLNSTSLLEFTTMNVHTLTTADLTLSALDLAARLEAGETTPAAVLEQCEKAITRREGEIEAFVTLDLDRARGLAQTASQMLTAKPLRGLPVAIKDIFDTVDFPTEYGSSIYAGHRPATDAAVVSQVRRAGGVALGKTVTTEFAHLSPGKTRNPRNPQHTPGGSSSGSAAAVAAGMIPIAIGSQTGGSVIRPAAFCGIAGFKPSYGLLPTVGMKCFSWHLDTVGVFASGVADVAFAAGALADCDLRVDRTPPAAPSIGICRTHIWSEASQSMQAAIEAAANAAASAGARVLSLTLPPILEEAFRAHPIIQDYEAYRALAFEYDYHRDRLAPPLRKLLDNAAGISAQEYDDARRTARRAREQVAVLLEETDVLLTPSAPGPPPSGLGSTGNPIFNRLWTLMGTPCVNVPGLADANGLPLGIQIVGRFGRDKSTLEAALFVEQAIARGAS